MAQRAIVLFVLLSTACSDDTTPTAPSGTTPPAAPPAGIAAELTGVVRDERGVPVPGATVVLELWPTPVSTLTDPEGRYELRATVRPNSGCCVVSAVRASYEKNVQFTPETDATQDFVLRDVLRIAAGESRRLVIGPEDSLDGLDFEFRARVVHVAARVTGPVDLEVVSEGDGVRFGLFAGRGLPTTPPPTRLTLAMLAGTEMEVRVLLPHWDYGAPQTFTLETSTPSGSRVTARY